MLKENSINFGAQSCKIVEIDFTEIERRCIEILGVDFNTATACEMFEVKPEEVTPDMLRRAKVVNFGRIYGRRL